jgi:hypothetical protein
MVNTWNGLVGPLLFLSSYERRSNKSGLVIVLIAAEILVAAINIIVDLYAGVE